MNLLVRNATALVLFGFVIANAAADPPLVDEAPYQKTVSVMRLDLARLADAETLYERIRAAAHAGCRAQQAMWDVKRVLHKKRCVERVVAETIARVDYPLLSAVHRSFGERFAER